MGQSQAVFTQDNVGEIPVLSALKTLEKTPVLAPEVM